MASRAELKKRAKSCLKQYYWMAFLVSLVALILGASGDTDFNFSFTGRSGSRYFSSGFDSGDFLLFASIFIAIFVFALIVGILIQTFLSNVVRVGLCSYFLESRKTKTDAGFQRLFFGFGGGKYMKLVKVMFMKNLIVFGWTLLLIIPGIIKAYQYAMVPYMMAENPDLDYRSALDGSREMMAGHKFRLFVLELSFIGWELLGILACCIGVLFVLPYQNATFAEFYADLKENEYKTVY